MKKILIALALLPLISNHTVLFSMSSHPSQGFGGHASSLSRVAKRPRVEIDSLVQAKTILQRLPQDLRSNVFDFLTRWTNTNVLRVSCSQSLKFSNDQSKILDFNKDGLKVFGLDDAKPVYNYETTPDEFAINDAVWHPKSTQIALCIDNTIQVHDIAAQSVLQNFQIGNGENDGCTIEFSPDGKKLAVSLLGSGKLLIYDITTSKCLLDFKACLTDGNNIDSILFTPDGAIMITKENTPNNDGTRFVKAWDVKTGTLLRTFNHKGIVQSTHLNNSANHLFSRSSSTAKVWDLATGALLSTMRHSDAEEMDRAKFHPDGTMIITTSKKMGKVWDVATESCLCKFSNPDHNITTAAWNPSNKTVAIGHEDGTIQIWDVEKGTHCCTLKDDQKVLRLRFSANGNYLWSGGRKHHVQLWEKKLSPEDESVQSYCLKSDEKQTNKIILDEFVSSLLTDEGSIPKGDGLEVSAPLDISAPMDLVEEEAQEEQKSASASLENINPMLAALKYEQENRPSQPLAAVTAPSWASLSSSVSSATSSKESDTVLALDEKKRTALSTLSQ